MKRIIAIITLAVAVLAVPATAMASTSGSGSASGSASGGGSGTAQVMVVSGVPKGHFCPLPLRGIQVKAHGKAGERLREALFAKKHGRFVRVRVKGKGKVIRFRCLVPAAAVPVSS